VGLSQLRPNGGRQVTTFFRTWANDFALSTPQQPLSTKFNTAEWPKAEFNNCLSREPTNGKGKADDRTLKSDFVSRFEPVLIVKESTTSTLDSGGGMERSSLPTMEHFSPDPRRLRNPNQIPLLSLLGLNTDEPRCETARAVPPPLPPLKNYPALRAVDESEVRRLPGAPLLPAEVAQVFADRLVPLEHTEIFKFKEIWYVGTLESKPSPGLFEGEYRDGKKQYIARANDHILYRYQIFSEGGRGAFSNVYRCFDHKNNVPVAIKVIRAKSSCMEYAEIEADIQKRIRGQFCVHLLEAFFWRGHYCLVLELLYTDIYSIVERWEYQRFPANLVRHIAFQSLLGLRELARLGIVHADIKPENLLAGDKHMMVTKVGDFGTACLVSQQYFSYVQSRYYRAPEILYGLRYGPPIDMWSIGCVVYELIVGEPLYPAEDELELAKMIEISIGPPPPDIYRLSLKWHQFPRQGIFASARSDCRNMEPLTFLTAPLPRLVSKFIRACLVWDPDARLTAEQALATDWFIPEWEFLRKSQEKRKIVKSRTLQDMSPKSARTEKMRPSWHN
jgi:dual specificity tyrosine-phosphorylation-regulated kinase 2/3/4